MDNPGRRPVRAQFDEYLPVQRPEPGSMASDYHACPAASLSHGRGHRLIRAPNAYAAYTNGSSGMAEDFPANTPACFMTC